jgi:uncharacterized membrane-anchored protein YhcB (DUF1043 family)
MTWAQVVIALVVGVTGVGFAQVMRALFGRRLQSAQADAQVVKNAKDIIDELKERQSEIVTQWKVEVKELRDQVASLAGTLTEERQKSQQEVARLNTEIAIKDRELILLRQQNGTL